MRGSFWLGIGTVSVLAGFGTFLGVRALTGGSGSVRSGLETGAAQAQAPAGNATPFADAPGSDATAKQAFAADLAQPRFTGTLAGMKFEGGANRGPDYNCGANAVVHPDFGAASGTPFDIFARTLPSGMSVGSGSPGGDQPYAAECGGVLIATDRAVTVSTPAGAQLVTIGRALTPTPWTTSNFPETRASAGTVAGQPTVLVRSILADGRGGSYVIWADYTSNGYVVTTIYGGNAPLSAIEPVAEAIANQAGSAR